MSKKKNTLKDLDAFLKQQAATLVPPDPLSTNIETPATPPPAPQPPVAAVVTEAAPVVTATATPVAPAAPAQEQEITPEKILSDIRRLADREGSAFRKTFYDLIIRSIETRPQSLPEDKMLINTALYLKSGDQWKDVIRDYWKLHR